MTIAQKEPTDLIPMREAIQLVKRSRLWIEARVPVYRVERIDKVSKQAVLEAEKEYSTPKLKDGMSNEKGD